MDTKAFTVTGGWKIGWSFECSARTDRRGASLAVIVNAGSSAHWSAGEVVDFWFTPPLRSRTGTRAEHRAGTYRLFIVAPPQCAWTIRALASGES